MSNYQIAAAFLSTSAVILALGVIHIGWRRSSPSRTAAVELIQPATVQRDERGAWYHPDMPVFNEDGAKFTAWIEQQGLQVARSSLEYEDPSHPVYKSFFEQEDPDTNFGAWVASPPPGEGWFTLAIDDTEDGPQWWWARRAEGGAA